MEFPLTRAKEVFSQKVLTSAAKSKDKKSYKYTDIRDKRVLFGEERFFLET
jgi:hypothetical protein